MQRCVRLQKQTLRPPRNPIPLATNPLTRWSRRLPKWADLDGALTHVQVGVEGCHSAFNATNSIRTCLYFQTAFPPTFLRAASWKAIEHVQLRKVPCRDWSADEKPEPLFLNAGEVTHSATQASLAGPDMPAAASESPFDGIALFGEGDYFSELSHPTCVEGEPASAVPHASSIVALENFSDRAQSIMRTRLPTAAIQKGGCIRLVVGHENWGVRRSLLRAKNDTTLMPLCDGRRSATLAHVPHSTPPPVADMVVYVPQYGTTSSLNVVTSLGIALFYCYMDAACPKSREIYSAGSLSCSTADHAPSNGASSADDLDDLRRRLNGYQAFFSKALPAPETWRSESELIASDAPSPEPRKSVGDAHVNTTPRVDQRPLHPVFYLRNSEEIQRQLRAYRQSLLRYSGGPHAADRFRHPRAEGSTPSPLPLSYFGLSVLYENDYDQRNFGGLIRSANAFLVDYIFYVGRRKVNVVGAVGSYHYTPPVHLGPLPDTQSVAFTSDTTSGNTPRDWGAEIHARVEEAYGFNAPRNWWLLDCGHDFLYEATSEGQRACSGCGVDAAVSSPASLQTYRQLKVKGLIRSLCDTEASLRESTEGGLVLLVPQEGRLPHPALMRLCTGVLTVLPEGAHFGEHRGNAADICGRGGSGHRGLPSQVASGVALQRLSAVMHPRLAAL
ncbi:hypothetical protein, conserved [Leishmania tarentolae]|uniref:tRNA/rRNA methyltransferase SpoU type domain-containing protein n=1 Tax=Leishmania tarentolae TaxID=5689 RepID=A0A640KVF5_LEITA|nr:hypothetical protein, conserved [Leishmania tarentolae]